MAGMTIDPNKCMKSAVRLMAQGTLGSVTVDACHSFSSNVGPLSAVAMTGGSLGLVLLVNDFLLGGYYRSLFGMGLARFVLHAPEAIQDVWNDCDIGGGLKRRVEQFKESASQLAEKLLPAPAKPLPIAAQYGAVDLSTDWGPRTTSLPGDALLPSGQGLVYKGMKVFIGGAALIYGGVVLAPIVASAAPASVPALAGAAAL